MGLISRVSSRTYRLDLHKIYIMPKRAASPKKAPAKAKKAKDPNAPKRPLSSYFLFLSDFRARMKKEDPELAKSIKEFGKAAGAEWRSMSDDDKQPYQEQHEELKEEYDEAMKHYTPPKGFGKTGASKKSKAQKDPNAPKKPQTAFFLFMADNRSRVKREDPDLAHTEVAKQLGQEWQNLDSNEKSKYERTYQKAIAQWKKDQAAYDQSDKQETVASSESEESDSE